MVTSVTENSQTSGSAETQGAPVKGCTHPQERVRLLFRAQDPVTAEWFHVGFCKDCRLNVTVPQPPESEIGRYYPPAYYGTGDRYLPVIEWLLDRMYRMRLKRVTSGVTPGRALDIGCGRGLLLARLRDMGWEVQGTELSETSARYGREVLNLDIETKNLGDANFPDASFDLVIIWHVLEHLYAPQETLREIHRILKPDGAFLVAVPNFSSWEARFGKRHWFHLNVPGHLTHFSKQTLERDLKEAGFEVKHRTFFSSEYDFFSIVQTAQNRLGLRFNLLYDLLRRRTAQFGSPGGGPPAGRRQKLAALALAAPMGLASLLYAPIAALARQGATVQIIARKKS
jgi:SAM-dependent methyltransferase